jgi:hypothetical protein
MDMTPALPALSPSHQASTRSDVVSEKTASRARAKIFFVERNLGVKQYGAEGKHDRRRPYKTVASGVSSGAEISTRPAPACPLSADAVIQH